MAPSHVKRVLGLHQTPRIAQFETYTQYLDLAKAKFATGADGWLVAYARVHGATVVTNEQSAPESKREIKLPDVCDQFGVQRENIFAMLRALNVCFDWAGDG